METQKKTMYKYCIVPMCKNTSVTAPNKHYFNVPRTAHGRKKWCKVIKRDHPQLSVKSHLYCCEDHFDLEKDTNNFIEYNLMREVEGYSVHLRLKKGVLPHIFFCQKREEIVSMKTDSNRRNLEVFQESNVVATIFTSSDSSESDISISGHLTPNMRNVVLIKSEPTDEDNSEMELPETEVIENNYNDPLDDPYRSNEVETIYPDDEAIVELKTEPLFVTDYDIENDSNVLKTEFIEDHSNYLVVDGTYISIKV